MWHNTARSPEINLFLFSIDARALFAVAIWCLHMSWVTLWLSLAGILVFALLMRKGYTPGVAFRLLRRRLAGPVKYATDTVQLRRWGRWT